MAALTWTTLRNELMAALVQGPSPYTVIPADFATLYTAAISYAEARICAEVPLLANRTQNTQLVTVSGSRRIDLAGMTNPLVVQEGLSLISPAAQTNPALGNRIPFDKATLDFIDLIWPVEATTMDPALADNIGRFWAPLNSGSTTAAYTGNSSIIVIAPTPNGIFTAEVTGLFQPTPLSSGNASTYLSTVYPDLLFAACMVFLSGALKRNYGSQSDSAPQAVSWESQFEVLKEACQSEEMRRRGMTPDQPRPAEKAA